MNDILDQNKEIISVGELNRSAKAILESNFSSVSVLGEISNLAQPSSGHIYFTLKDAEGSIRCAMFKNQKMRMNFTPKDGDQCVLKGQVSLYTARGDYQLIVRQMQPAGIGNLMQQFEELKQKLDKEGLFDPLKKKDIPYPPKHIGVITSASTAALQDVISTVKRRAPSSQVTLSPAMVQGDTAPQAIIKALDLILLYNETAPNPIDTVLMTRGGGSIEDLWAFNEEKLAKTVFNCDVPIISAVGHETDFTISDFVSDVRAATPTEAAEIISLSVDEISSVIKKIEDRMINIVVGINQSKIVALDEFINRLMTLDPSNVIESRKIALNHLYNFMVKHINELAEVKKIKFLSLANQLRSIGPEKVLKRGFSIAVEKETKKIIRSANDIFSGADFMLKTGNGSFEAKKIN